jgi:hypothetical protein
MKSPSPRYGAGSPFPRTFEIVRKCRNPAACAFVTAASRSVQNAGESDAPGRHPFAYALRV